jgi:hypothetical protein
MSDKKKLYYQEQARRVADLRADDRLHECYSLANLNGQIRVDGEQQGIEALYFKELHGLDKRDLAKLCQTKKCSNPYHYMPDTTKKGDEVLAVQMWLKVQKVSEQEDDSLTELSKMLTQILFPDSTPEWLFYYTHSYKCRKFFLEKAQETFEHVHVMRESAWDGFILTEGEFGSLSHRSLLVLQCTLKDMDSISGQAMISKHERKEQYEKLMVSLAAAIETKLKLREAYRK